jgi:hypothetical protein
MNGTNAAWRKELRKRFADREDIGKECLYEKFFAAKGFPRSDVLELFDTIELEFDLPAGLLRPTDSLKKLGAPVSPKNPWQWMVFQVRSGDSQQALADQLEKRLKTFGTTDLWKRVETIADLVTAWCGQAPAG